MRLRYLPYATRPGRLLAQLCSDIFVVLWTAAWVLVGVAVHAAVATIAGVGRQVNSGAHGIATNLQSAGHSAERIPLVAARSASRSPQPATRPSTSPAPATTWTPLPAGWPCCWRWRWPPADPGGGDAVAISAAAVFRRKWTVTALAATPAGEQLLALRALANRPLRRLTAVDADPVGAWRREDPVTIAGLAALELRSAGLQTR
ncbi:putative transmembrane protein [Mycobacterium xenopi 4042]|uniref:Putative transmembrane protein n=1 Tax=Mycobacterium xenopi 4042 TaxID=1299334 RepID=X7ZVD5_MYCXE|nr:putative transmembrane protein [Mycobacterium xenopi 4042]